MFIPIKIKPPTPREPKNSYAAKTYHLILEKEIKTPIKTAKIEKGEQKK